MATRTNQTTNTPLDRSAQADGASFVDGSNAQDQEDGAEKGGLNFSEELGNFIGAVVTGEFKEATRVLFRMVGTEALVFLTVKPAAFLALIVFWMYVLAYFDVTKGVHDYIANHVRSAFKADFGQNIAAQGEKIRQQIDNAIAHEFTLVPGQQPYKLPIPVAKGQRVRFKVYSLEAPGTDSATCTYLNNNRPSEKPDIVVELFGKKVSIETSSLDMASELNRAWWTNVEKDNGKLGEVDDVRISRSDLGAANECYFEKVKGRLMIQTYKDFFD